MSSTSSSPSVRPAKKRKRTRDDDSYEPLTSWEKSHTTATTTTTAASNQTGSGSTSRTNGSLLSRSAQSISHDKDSQESYEAGTTQSSTSTSTSMGTGTASSERKKTATIASRMRDRTGNFRHSVHNGHPSTGSHSQPQFQSQSQSRSDSTQSTHAWNRYANATISSADTSRGFYDIPPEHPVEFRIKKVSQNSAESAMSQTSNANMTSDSSTNLLRAVRSLPPHARPLGPIPVVSPSAFRPYHRPQVSPKTPCSTIDEFSSPVKRYEDRDVTETVEDGDEWSRSFNGRPRPGPSTQQLRDDQAKYTEELSRPKARKRDSQAWLHGGAAKRTLTELREPHQQTANEYTTIPETSMEQSSPSGADVSDDLYGRDMWGGGGGDDDPNEMVEELLGNGEDEATATFSQHRPPANGSYQSGLEFERENQTDVLFMTRGHDPPHSTSQESHVSVSESQHHSREHDGITSTQAEEIVEDSQEGKTVEDSQQSQPHLAVRTQPKASLASLLPHPPLPPLAAALRPQDDSVAVVPASTPQQTTLLTQPPSTQNDGLLAQVDGFASAVKDGARHFQQLCQQSLKLMETLKAELQAKNAEIRQLREDIANQTSAPSQQQDLAVAPSTSPNVFQVDHAACEEERNQLQEMLTEAATELTQLTENLAASQTQTQLLKDVELELAETKARLAETEKDRDFFRARHVEVDAFASEARLELSQLRESEALARSQARDGVDLIQRTFEGTLDTLQQELVRVKGQNFILREKDRLTTDDVRHRAAQFDEAEVTIETWKRRAQNAEKELADILKQLEASNDNDSSEHGYVEVPCPDSSSSDDDDGDYEPDTPQHTPPRSTVPAPPPDAALDTPNMNAAGVTSPRSPESNMLDPNELVYRCSWRSNEGRACGMLFPLKPDFHQHYVSTHSLL